MKRRVLSLDEFVQANQQKVAYAFLGSLEGDTVEIKIYSTEDRNDDHLIKKQTFDKNDIEKQQEFLDTHNAVYLK